MKNIILSISLALCFVCFPAQAQTAQRYEPGYTILESRAQYDVNEDGTYTLDQIESVRINSEIALKQLGQIPLPFSTSLQALEVLEAYTTTKEGKRIDVAPEKIFLQQSPMSEKAAMFSDIKLKTIVFPALEVGATLSMHYQRKQIKSLFSGRFSMIERISRTDEFKSASITVTAPESLPLFFDAKDIPGGEIKSDQPGRKMWRWSLQNTIAHLPEPGSVGPADFSPRIAATSFSSYNDVAKAYLDQATRKTNVTPEIQKLANEITRGVTDKRSQVAKLYNWVSMNIRYVAVFLDLGGVVPHEANEILAAKYGDCKDSVALLQALLAAKGIKSSPVLVNATNEYWVPSVAAAPGQFNHVITYVPELDLFIDPAAKVATIGVLPPTEIGKTALLTDDGTGQSKLVKLPETQLGNKNAEYVNTTLEISNAGDIDGKRQVTSQGAMDFVARALFSNVPKGMERQLASQSLSSTGQQGAGDFHFGDTRNLFKPFSYEIQFNLPGYVTPGRGSMSMPIGISSLSGIEALLRSVALAKRDFPVSCFSGIREETTAIKLPEGMKQLELPKSVKVENNFGLYESSYSANQQVITVKRTLDLKLPGVCSGEDYTNFLSMTREISRDLRSKISYQ